MRVELARQVGDHDVGLDAHRLGDLAAAEPAAPAVAVQHEHRAVRLRGPGRELEQPQPVAHRGKRGLDHDDALVGESEQLARQLDAAATLGEPAASRRGAFRSAIGRLALEAAAGRNADAPPRRLLSWLRR
jgi:hypothetical protein